MKYGCLSIEQDERILNCREEPVAKLSRAGYFEHKNAAQLHPFMAPQFVPKMVIKLSAVLTSDKCSDD
jgi:hypothetical protein